MATIAPMGYLSSSYSFRAYTQLIYNHNEYALQYHSNIILKITSNNEINNRKKKNKTIKIIRKIMVKIVLMIMIILINNDNDKNH